MHFEGEAGVDAGGLSKEYMQVVFRELLDPQYTLFARFETNLIYFNPNTFEAGRKIFVV